MYLLSVVNMVKRIGIVYVDVGHVHQITLTSYFLLLRHEYEQHIVYVIIKSTRKLFFSLDFVMVNLFGSEDLVVFLST